MQTKKSGHLLVNRVLAPLGVATFAFLLFGQGGSEHIHGSGARRMSAFGRMLLGYFFLPFSWLFGRHTGE